MSSLNNALDSALKSVGGLLYNYRAGAGKFGGEGFLIFDIGKSFLDEIDYR